MSLVKIYMLWPKSRAPVAIPAYSPCFNSNHLLAWHMLLIMMPILGFPVLMRPKRLKSVDRITTTPVTRGRAGARSKHQIDLGHARANCDLLR